MQGTNKPWPRPHCCGCASSLDQYTTLTRLDFTISALKSTDQIIYDCLVEQNVWTVCVDLPIWESRAPRRRMELVGFHRRFRVALWQDGAISAGEQPLGFGRYPRKKATAGTSAKNGKDPSVFVYPKNSTSTDPPCLFVSSGLELYQVRSCAWADSSACCGCFASCGRWDLGPVLRCLLRFSGCFFFFVRELSFVRSEFFFVLVRRDRKVARIEDVDWFSGAIFDPAYVWVWGIYVALLKLRKEFDALFLMTTAIRSSFMVLGWTIILLFVCQMLLGDHQDGVKKGSQKPQSTCKTLNADFYRLITRWLIIWQMTDDLS